jgi:LacI family transcriptional regulator
VTYRETVASIREVAELSGVSIATVSRVLNGSPRVREDTRRRVLERAGELGYVPNAAARTLVRQRSQLIGVVLDTGTGHADLQHPFFQEVLVGLNEHVGEQDYDLLVFSNRRHAFHERAVHHQVDGMVLLSADPKAPELARLLAAQVPTIAVDLPVEGRRAAHVASDNAGGARLAVRHLHERGHTRIATIGGLEHHLSSVERLAGYLDELAVLRLKPRKRWLERGDFYTASGYAAARRLLALREPPTAIFAASDLMAVGALQAAREAGLHVPEDLAIVGFDDVPLASLVEPALTTIRQDKHGLGRVAGEALFALIDSPNARPASVTLPVELVVRGST